MLSPRQIEEERARVDALWDNPPARNNAFGNSLKSVKVEGVRGVSVEVEFQWPVVALGGTNGSGKTTLLQASSAAYSKPNTTTRHYSLGRWFRPALARETPPVADDAEISYAFWDQTPTIVVPYKKTETRWRYPRRGNPQKDQVQFIGIADFAPRIEQKDRAYHNRARLEVRGTQQLDSRINQSVAAILSKPYVGAQAHTVSATGATWNTEILQLDQNGVSVTEANMGAGEQKILRLARQLETLPRKSLVLLEEPELTLHPDAQLGFAYYLMTLARRQGHQIIVATHSPHIFEALPRRARVILLRDAAGVQALHGVSHLSAALSLGSSVRTNRDMILVEDDVAKRFLKELIARHDHALSRSAAIVPVGSKEDVRRLATHFRRQGLRCVGVRDPDAPAEPQAGILSIPGDLPIENLLLAAENIQRSGTLVSGIAEAHALAEVRAHGLVGAEAAKRTFQALHQELGVEESELADRLTLGWLQDAANNEAAQGLVQAVRASLDKVGD